MTDKLIKDMFEMLRKSLLINVLEIQALNEKISMFFRLAVAEKDKELSEKAFSSRDEVTRHIREQKRHIMNLQDILYNNQVKDGEE